MPQQRQYQHLNLIIRCNRRANRLKAPCHNSFTQEEPPGQCKIKSVSYPKNIISAHDTFTSDCSVPTPSVKKSLSPDYRPTPESRFRDAGTRITGHQPRAPECGPGFQRQPWASGPENKSPCFPETEFCSEKQGDRILNRPQLVAAAGGRYYSMKSSAAAPRDSII